VNLFDVQCLFMLGFGFQRQNHLYSLSLSLFPCSLFAKREREREERREQRERKREESREREREKRAEREKEISSLFPCSLYTKREEFSLSLLSLYEERGERFFLRREGRERERGERERDARSLFLSLCTSLSCQREKAEQQLGGDLRLKERKLLRTLTDQAIKPEQPPEAIGERERERERERKKLISLFFFSLLCKKVELFTYTMRVYS